MRVGWAQKNTSLYVGGLEGGAITTELLQREFARFGPLDKDLTAIKPGGEREREKKKTEKKKQNSSESKQNEPVRSRSRESRHGRRWCASEGLA